MLIYSQCKVHQSTVSLLTLLCLWKVYEHQITWVLWQRLIGHFFNWPLQLRTGVYGKKWRHLLFKFHALLAGRIQTLIIVIHYAYALQINCVCCSTNPRATRYCIETDDGNVSSGSFSSIGCCKYIHLCDSICILSYW